MDKTKLCVEQRKKLKRQMHKHVNDAIDALPALILEKPISENQIKDIENSLLLKIYNELMATTNHWPEDLENIFYKYLEERGLYPQ